MRIVLDTNVLVSGLIRPGSNPSRVVDLVLSGQVAVALDQRIFAEYHEVLWRPEFELPRAHVVRVLEFLWQSADRIQAAPLPVRLPDPDDVKFIEVAVAAGVHALVTGNVKHFPPGERHGVRVLTPREFLRFWAHGSP